MPTSKERKLSAFRLTDEGRELLSLIADSMGISLTAAVEIIVREAARKREIV